MRCQVKDCACCRRAPADFWVGVAMGFGWGVLFLSVVCALWWELL